MIWFEYIFYNTKIYGENFGIPISPPLVEIENLPCSCEVINSSVIICSSCPTGQVDIEYSLKVTIADLESNLFYFYYEGRIFYLV